MIKKWFTALRYLWRRRYGVLPQRESLSPLATWFSSPLGRRILDAEQPVADELLNNLFGYYLLQLGVTGTCRLIQENRISHKFVLHPLVCDSCRPSALADFNHLPLPPQSIDVVVLHHALDYSQSPHHLLREAANLVIPNGHMLIVGFNPVSLLGIYRWLARWFVPFAPWRHQALLPSRVRDWLAVLDFVPVETSHTYHQWPLVGDRFQAYGDWINRVARKLGLPFGGVYVILAKNETFAVTPIKPQWQGYAGLRGWGVTKILGRAGRHGTQSKV